MLFLLSLAWGTPVATFGLDADDGTVVWDATGTAHGCVEGPFSRVPGVVEGGMSLEGGHVVLPLSALDPGGVAAYVRGADEGTVLAMGDVVLRIEAGAWVLGGITVTDPAPSATSWRHVAVTLDDGLATLWVGQVSMGSSIVDAPGPVVLGSAVDGSDAWRGEVDEVAVIDGVVTADDLRVLTTGFRGPTEGADCGDYDKDGLGDVVELALGTDPTLRDTDRDTFDDLTEVGDPADPTDTDQDGLIDALDDDDDNDGISSLVERISDADGDGAPDLDPDGDGIENGTDDDSDGDGILDVNEGTEDSDGDGIADFLDPDLPRTMPVDTGTEAPATADGSAKGDGCGCTSTATSWWGWGLFRRRHSGS